MIFQTPDGKRKREKNDREAKLQIAYLFWPSPAIGDFYVIHSHLRMCAALKRMFYSKKKNSKNSKHFQFFFIFIMQLFSANATVFSKKILNVLTLKTWKPLWKLLIIGPQLFLCTGLAAQTAQKQKSSTTKSPLMQDWSKLHQ